MIAFSFFAMGSNYWMFGQIGQYFPTTATYQIQRIDCLVTVVSQIGTIALFFASMDVFCNKYVCIIATCGGIVGFLQPIVSCLFLAIIP